VVLGDANRYSASTVWLSLIRFQEITVSSAWPYPFHIAHRGAGSAAPENTLAAFRVGARHGFRMFELDAKLSGDGTLVLMHDETLERTTTGKGRVAGSSFAELARLDAGQWHSPRFVGEPVPTLAKVMAWAQANDVMLNIEIKPCPGREVETAAAVALEVRALWRALPWPIVSSFSEVAVATVRELAPELPRALLLHEFDVRWLERCQSLGVVALDANQRWLTESIIAQAHAAGLRVLTYTVNDEARANDLERWGVDGLITDRVDTIRPTALG
jgi:glycerophosphoryl diester phosphodiesterase